jgi:glutamate racemase
VRKNILVFDSGIGGFSVFQALYQQLPHCTYAYAADNALLPYGDKPDSLLQSRIVPLFEKLLAEFNADIAVIACNTASTLLLDILRQHFDIPFVGVVPAIKPAALHSKNRHIALLATPATVNRDYIDQLSQDHAADCAIKHIASTQLVKLAEDKILHGHDVSQAVSSHIATLDIGGAEIDTVILGCTHFPLLLDELKQAWPRNVSWQDSSQAIANRTEDLLKQMTTSAKTATATVFTTSCHNAEAITQLFQPFGLEKQLTIELSL